MAPHAFFTLVAYTHKYTFECDYHVATLHVPHFIRLLQYIEVFGVISCTQM